MSQGSTEEASLGSGLAPIPTQRCQPGLRDARAPQRGAAAFKELAPGEELKHVLISLKSPARLNPNRLGLCSIM